MPVKVVRCNEKILHGSGVPFYPLRRAIVVRDAIKKPRNSGVNFTLAGTVKNPGGTGLSRKIIAYKGGSETVVSASTWSDSQGNFSTIVNGNSNDEFRVEVLGDVGENTVVFDHVRPE